MLGVRAGYWLLRDTMNLIDLCKLGKEEIDAMRRAGTLKASHLWVGAMGAIEYQKAIATGDVCSEAHGQERIEQGCLLCPFMVSTTSLEPTIVKHWCGPPLEDHTDTALPTCGCLVGLTIAGKPTAGALTMKASGKCIQGKWRAKPRASTMPQDAAKS